MLETVKLKQVVIEETQELITLHAPNNAGEMKLIIQDGAKVTKIAFRNVGERHPAGSIQFTCEEYTIRTNRTKHFSFSVPFEMAELFLQHLAKVRE